MIIPIPIHHIEESVAPDPEDRGEWIRWFLDCEHWRCTCGITNFGRNKFCARWTCKKPRPTSYVESVFPTPLH
jgi:hypothetical protein